MIPTPAQEFHCGYSTDETHYNEESQPESANQCNDCEVENLIEEKVYQGKQINFC
jgi:hypothetical protein